MRRRRSNEGAYGYCVVAFALAAWSGSALALQPLITDDTDAQGAGRNQLEGAFDRERVRNPDERSTQHTVTVVYTRGLTDALDGYIEASHVRLRTSAADGDARGSGNPAVGFKWRFWEDEAAKHSVALKPEV